ncbi:hypothetical protein GCM10023086_44770 [Streptomyces venetus]|uniref:Uncharacterized protein n=1 Tax=Streptomyces venetus TaxID=1701086 RepID=A0ABP8GA15_9ACTN
MRVTVEETPVGGLRHAADGENVCACTADGREPQVRVGIHNSSGRDLWAVLLDLTDGYASSPHLFRLPAWSTAAPSGARLSPGPAAGSGLLRLVAAGVTGGRDTGGPPAYGAGRWGTAQVVVRTQV